MKNLLKLFCKELTLSSSYVDNYNLVDDKNNVIHTGTWKECMGFKKIMKSRGSWRTLRA
jgi:hypothetical protein